VTVLDQLEGARVVGVVELVSPGNKDRAESRAAFVAMCGGYLQSGIGLIVVDVVTSRRANLHNELVEAMHQPPAFAMADTQGLYALAYRPVSRHSEMRSIVVGFTRGRHRLACSSARSAAWFVVPVDLEAAYMDARQQHASDSVTRVMPTGQRR
jgi:hypothetical protein